MKKFEEPPVREDRALRFPRECRDVVQEILPDGQVILGSRACGDASALSSYNLLILAANDVGSALVQRLLDAIYNVSLEHDAVPSMFVFSRRLGDSPAWRGTPFHADVKLEGALA